MSVGTIPRKGRSYEIFCAEMARHLTRIRDLFAKGPLPEECQELSRVFHTIKGGAGFFGFSTIHKNAAILEKVFKNPELNYSAEKNELAKLFAEIEADGSTLPPPEE